ncbi:MAG: serine hydrolase [Lentisphaeria bacterium]|nr:serine hydrolase [Lentisphaeria bacterium]
MCRARSEAHERGRRFLAAFLFCLPAVLLLTACSSTLPDYPRSEEGVRQLLQDFADDYIRDTRSVGVVAGVILPDGAAFTAVSGRSDVLDPEKKLDADTIFPIGSLTKNMVFAMVTELERQGRIDLDTPLKDCPGLEELPEEYAPITVRDLLLHRSGLPRESYTLTSIWPVISAEIWDGNVYEDYTTREGLIETLSNSECRSAVSHPRIRYSNLGYGLLGLALESLTGETVPDLMDTFIIRPWGLKDTSFGPPEGKDERLAGTHSGDIPFFWFRGRHVRSHDLGEGLRTAGGVWSSAADQMRCLRNYRETFLAMDRETPFSGASETVVHYNYYLVDSPAGHRCLIRYGMTFGVASFFGVDLDNRTAILVLRNNCDWPDGVGMDLMSRLEKLLPDAESWPGKDADTSPVP